MPDDDPGGALYTPPLPYFAPPVREWYTYDDLAELLQMAKVTLYGHVREGRMPGPTYFGRAARFAAADVAKLSGGLAPAGTYTPAESPQAKLVREGQKEAARKRKEAERGRRRRAAARAKREGDAQ